jgi:glucans biosynthesis protein C
MFYLHRMGQPGFREPYWRFWLRFFDPAAMAAGLPASGTWRSGGTEFDPGHLWFLFCLLIFSVALVPLFSWFRRPRGRRLIDGIAGAAERHGAVVLVAAVVPIMAVETARGPDTTTGGWERLTYVFPFLYGYLIASDRRLEAAIRRLRWPALGCAVIASLALAAGVRVLAGAGEVAARAAPQLSALQALAGWAWVVTIVGFAGAVAGQVRSRPPAQITPERGRWRRAVWYANQAVLPFYLLHQPVIVAVAWLAVRWHAPVAVKFAVVVTVSFALTVALYEAVVRRFRLGRFLFGMRPAATPRPWPIHERTVL